MAVRLKKRIFSGPVCEQVIYTAQTVEAGAKGPSRPRFKNDEERATHRRLIARRHCARLVNANFTPAGYFITLTFDRESEVEDFIDARKERDNFRRRLTYRCPNAKLMIFMGRGKSTSRIHFHVIAENVTEEAVKAAWPNGTVCRMSHLREHNKDKNGKDLGRDLTAVSDYCFDHWTPEQGGHYYSRTKNLTLPEEEEPTECKREYSVEHPPVPPKGYELVEAFATPYGYLYFRYIKTPIEPPRLRRMQSRWRN